MEVPMAMEISDSVVAVPSGDLFVRQWQGGQTQKLPIILLHDSLGCVELWKDFPAALAAKTSRTVIAYDRLGFGQSSQRTQPPSQNFINEEAQIYFPAIARTLGLDGYVLFGHSVGGGMALTIAAQPYEGCKAVITVSAQAFVEEKTLAGIRAAKQGFEDEAQFSRLQKWHGARARWVLDAWTEVWLAPEFRDWSLDTGLDKIRCPVLAIHGDADEYGSEEFPRRIAQGVRGLSQMKIMASCGHVPHREKENEVLELVDAFMQEHVTL